MATDGHTTPLAVRESAQLFHFPHIAGGKCAIAKLVLVLCQDSAAQCPVCRWSSQGHHCTFTGLAVSYGG